MLFGYIRVSTKDQKMDLQEDSMIKAGVNPKNIYRDVASGAKSNREGLEKMMGKLRSGDTVVVWKLDRIARSVIDFVNLMEFFQENGISFRSIEEPFFNTTSAQGQFIYTIFSAVAQLERDLIRERTRAGLEAARRRGKVGGRRPGLSDGAKTTAKMAASLYNDPKNTIAEIMKTLNIKSKPTLYKYLRYEGIKIGRTNN